MLAIESLALAVMLLAQAPAKAQARLAAPELRGAQPARPAPAVAARRRAVHQVIDGMPPAYSPRLAPDLAPRLNPPPAPALPSPVAPGPAVISRCDAGGCNDTGGARYNGASGTLLSPQGRPCTTIAGVVSCQ